MVRKDLERNHWSTKVHKGAPWPTMVIWGSRVFGLTQAERELGEAKEVSKGGREGAQWPYIAQRSNGLS